MKFPWIICLAIIACNSATNNYSDDPLKKNSYYMFIYNSNGTGLAGTGFFMKVHNNIFFITAKHMIEAFDDSCKKTSTPVELEIILPIKNSRAKIHPVRINIEKIQNEIKCPIEIDVIAFKLYRGYESLDKYNINFIDTISYSSHIQLDSINIYGFPRIENGKKFVEYLHEEGVGLTSPVAEVFENSYKIKNGQKTIDSCNYMVKLQGVHIDSLVDFSGAPVLAKNKLSGKWFFLGCCTSSGIISEYITVLKPQIIYSEIRKVDH